MEPLVVKWRYSSGILQGRLEIPCQFIFEGDIKYVRKVERLISSKEKITAVEDLKLAKTKVKTISDDIKVVDITQDSKRPKLAVQAEEAGLEVNVDTEWVHIFNITLKMSDRALLLMGKELTDLHINAAQKLIMHQFPSYQGLKNIDPGFYGSLDK